MGSRLRQAEESDAPRISELLGQLGWSVAADAVVAELSAPATEVLVAEDEDEGQIVGVIALASRRQLHRAGQMDVRSSPCRGSAHGEAALARGWLVVQVQACDPGVAGTGAHPGDDLVDAVPDAFQHGFDGAVGVVAHPAVHPVGVRLPPA